MDLGSLLEQNSRLVEDELKRILSASDLPWQSVLDSMMYSLLAGGKRIRPALVIEFCKACGGETRDALDFACAVEMVHTYSLIHDDLPCMDDDELRRGKPTNHKVYGEATALLAGDALLTLAFDTLASSSNNSALSAVRVLAKAAGAMGMVGGQILDMEGENKTLTLDDLKLMHSMKTGALFTASAVLGCIAGSGDSMQIKAAEGYARSLGLAFQIRDDMLDVIGSVDALGKIVGMDEARGKSTFVTLLGIQRCEALVIEETAKAKSALGDNIFKDKDVLLGLADLLSDRTR